MYKNNRKTGKNCWTGGKFYPKNDFWIILFFIIIIIFPFTGLILFELCVFLFSEFLPEPNVVYSSLK